MGEAKRKRQQREQAAWPDADDFRGTIDLHTIDLHMLPPAATINGARIRELTGDDTIPDTQQIILPPRTRDRQRVSAAPRAAIFQCHGRPVRADAEPSQESGLCPLSAETRKSYAPFEYFAF
jgi:hypothetical protein